MRRSRQTKTLTALDRDGISLAQQTAGAGNLTITGAFASGGVATLSTQRRVGIYSGGNLSARTFTVYGTNASGRVISEDVTGPNATTVSTVNDYYTVTRVAVDAAIASDVEVGTTGVGATPWYPLNGYKDPFAVALAVNILSGSVDFTVQYTFNDVQDATETINATNHSSMTAKTTNTDSNIAFPAKAVRTLINSGSGTLEFIVQQAG